MLGDVVHPHQLPDLRYKSWRTDITHVEDDQCAFLPTDSRLKLVALDDVVTQVFKHEIAPCLLEADDVPRTCWRHVSPS